MAMVMMLGRKLGMFYLQAQWKPDTLLCLAVVDESKFLSDPWPVHSSFQRRVALSQQFNILPFLANVCFCTPGPVCVCVCGDAFFGCTFFKIVQRSLWQHYLHCCFVPLLISSAVRNRSKLPSEKQGKMPCERSCTQVETLRNGRPDHIEHGTLSS